MKFTLAQLSDTDLLIELMKEFYTHERISFRKNDARRALTQILSNRSLGVIYLVKSGQDVAGYLVLTFGFSLEFKGRDAIVDELYLRESFRGKGLGKKCLRLAEKLCRSEGIRAIHLEVERANKRAQALYRKTGYRDHDRYLLTKWLNSAAGNQITKWGI